jgi:hypothetical protein
MRFQLGELCMRIPLPVEFQQQFPFLPYAYSVTWVTATTDLPRDVLRQMDPRSAGIWEEGCIWVDALGPLSKTIQQYVPAIFFEHFFPPTDWRRRYYEDQRQLRIFPPTIENSPHYGIDYTKRSNKNDQGNHPS